LTGSSQARAKFQLRQNTMPAGTMSYLTVPGQQNFTILAPGKKFVVFNSVQLRLSILMGEKP